MLEEWARSGLVNILGGCCGTTPDHIAPYRRGRERRPAAPGCPSGAPAMRLAGLEAFELA